MTVVWPRGSTQAQLATIDDRLASLTATLREARGHHEQTLVDELEQRYDELLGERYRVASHPRDTD